MQPDNLYTLLLRVDYTSYTTRTKVRIRVCLLVYYSYALLVKSSIINSRKTDIQYLNRCTVNEYLDKKSDLYVEAPQVHCTRMSNADYYSRGILIVTKGLSRS